MDEVIVRVLRALACPTRLRVLYHLMGVTESGPTEMARSLRMRRDVLCVHLSRLASAGLLRRRRSGAKCLCSAGSPYGEHTLSGQVAAWVGEALAAGRQEAAASPSRQGRAVHGLQLPPGALRLLFDAATAFTHPRRIQIVRRLTMVKAAGIAALMQELRMSAAAAGRHLGKLIRRGYVRAGGPGRSGLYELVRDGKSPLHARLLAIISTHWGRRGQQA